MMIAKTIFIDGSLQESIEEKPFFILFVFHFFLFLVIKNKPKVDGDDSSNDWWRSDHEEELVRLISTPIVDAITKIDDNREE